MMSFRVIWGAPIARLQEGQLCARSNSNMAQNTSPLCRTRTTQILDCRCRQRNLQGTPIKPVLTFWCAVYRWRIFAGVRGQWLFVPWAVFLQGGDPGVDAFADPDWCGHPIKRLMP